LPGGFIVVEANGFCYIQFTGDSGAGARLGAFEGRTVGIAPMLSYAMEIGETDLVAEVN
jgi:hypothetical protein